MDDQYKREVAQLLNWHLLQKTMNESFSLRNAKGDTGENLQPGFDIYVSFFASKKEAEFQNLISVFQHLFKVLEAFISENDMAVFKAEDHTIESSTRVLKSAIKLFAEETAMKFFGQGTGVIEILNEQGQLQKLYYRKASNSKFLTKQIRDDIVEEVDRYFDT